jgi:hypothetical protein
MRSISRLIAALAVLTLPLPLLAQPIPLPAWTAVASTGTVDEANYTPVNFAFGGGPPGLPSLGFLGGSIGPPVVARYNVTNLAGFSNPPWTTLELGAIDTVAAAGNNVTARLIQVKPCTGTQAVLCTVVSLDNPAGGGLCNRCTFNVPIDFTQFLYYVEVTVSRTTAAANEQALTLRIF